MTQFNCIKSAGEICSSYPMFKTPELPNNADCYPENGIFLVIQNNVTVANNLVRSTLPMRANGSPNVKPMIHYCMFLGIIHILIAVYHVISTYDNSKCAYRWGHLMHCFLAIYKSESRETHSFQWRMHSIYILWFGIKQDTCTSDTSDELCSWFII